MVEPVEFSDLSAQPAIRGFLHCPDQPGPESLLLTHGAGSNCQSMLLAALARAFVGVGFTVLRCDLPFRQARRFGPPAPGSAARDREGIRRALEVLRQRGAKRVFAGGHSYGGRQVSMLAADMPETADALLLLSYPLHPPRKRGDWRTSHFSRLNCPSLFVHGMRDSFGLPEEMRSALELIPARHTLLEVDGAGHELLKKGASNGLPARIAAAFREFVDQQVS